LTTVELTAWWLRCVGFVRMALKHGCKLVPVFSFGENEIYDQVPNPQGSRVRKVQDWLYNKGM
jgi:hypothetical protein